MILVNFTEPFRMKFGFNYASWRDFRIMLFGLDLWVMTSKNVANDFIDTWNAGRGIKREAEA